MKTALAVIWYFDAMSLSSCAEFGHRAIKELTHSLLAYAELFAEFAKSQPSPAVDKAETASDAADPWPSSGWLVNSKTSSLPVTKRCLC